MRGSYLFENLELRHNEANFLAERAQLRLDSFPKVLARHGFPTKGRVLEVGCGQGIRTKIMADLYPDAQIIGIDRSEELLESARKNTENGNLSFQEGNLYELPFPNESFDFVYARLVFMHLEEPIRALLSLKRVLRPGGRILIEDADRDSMYFEPAPKSFETFWKKIKNAQRQLGGDPNVGRKLAPYLKETGFSNLDIEVQPIVGDGKEIDFLVRTLLPSLNLYQEPNERAAGDAAIQDLARLVKDPRATFYHFWFVVSAEA